MPPFITFLAAQAHAERVAVTPELNTALTELDTALEAMAQELQVEFHGPGVGVEGERGVYRLAVRAHREGFDPPRWGMKVCDALPNADWRVAWSIQNVARVRKAKVVQALPAFFTGYIEAIRTAGRDEATAAQQLSAWAGAFHTQ